MWFHHDTLYRVYHASNPSAVRFETPLWAAASRWIDDYCDEHRTRSSEWCIVHPINPTDFLSSYL